MMVLLFFSLQIIALKNALEGFRFRTPGPIESPPKRHTGSFIRRFQCFMLQAIFHTYNSSSI